MLARLLPLGKLAHIRFRRRDRSAKCAGQPFSGRRQIVRRHPYRFAAESVELSRVVEQRLVAALFDIRQNRRDGCLRLVEARSAALQQFAGFTRWKYSDHHITILFSGYSTIPCAPACLRRGMMSRTVDSSRMVFTASQSSSLKCEMVGRFNAGRTFNTASI